MLTSIRKAVVLLSGGLDSATTAAMARENGFLVHALTFRYGQRHEVEVEAAKRVAGQLGVERHIVMQIDLGAFGGSALTDDMPVPKDRSTREIGAGIPATYVPARNTIFLSYALAWAEVIDCYDIFLGVNCVDYSGYPDCRPQFVQAFQNMARVATRAAVEGNQLLTIHTPLIDLSKAEIIRTGVALGVDFGLTSSCYDPSVSGLSCGRCDACQLRLEGFRQAGVPDPIKYQSAQSS